MKPNIALALQEYATTNVPIDIITEKYGVSKSGLLYQVRINKLPHRDLIETRHRIYNFDLKKFQDDSADKYYWLGFIAADGSISKTGTCLSIQLKAEDISHLEKFRDFLDSNAKINLLWTNAGHLSCKININSRQFCDLLGAYGIVPKKSLIFMPTVDLIPIEYINDFLRGVFDGDGSISFTQRGQVSIKFTSGSKAFIEQILLWLKIDNKITVTQKTYSFSVTGNNKATAILDFLYQGSEEKNRLLRKYNRYLLINRPSVK